MSDYKDFLPVPPAITLSTESETDTGPGFIKVFHMKAKFNYPDGSQSNVADIDRINGNDAVAIVAFYKKDGENFIYLRSSVRPALSCRDFGPSGLPEEKPGNLWEVPAGLIDRTEVGIDGLLLAGSRELEEEVGFKVAPEKFFFLGKRTFPSVGITGERIFFVAADVTDLVRGTPSEDGGPFEAFGEVVSVKLSEAEVYVRDGYIFDAKTEIAIQRLKAYLNG